MFVQKYLISKLYIDPHLNKGKATIAHIFLMYRVESILEKKIENNQVFYKIKWEKYPEDQSTWEPLKNLRGVKEMVQQFEARNANARTVIKPKVTTSKTQKKPQAKLMIRKRSRSQNQNYSQGQSKKKTKITSNAEREEKEEKTQPNDKSSQEYYIPKGTRNDDCDGIEGLNMGLLSAKINELAKQKKSLKIVDMFKGQNSQFLYEVQRDGERKRIETRDFLLSNHYQIQMIQFYESRIQFQKANP